MGYDVTECYMADDVPSGTHELFLLFGLFFCTTMYYFILSMSYYFILFVNM